MSQIKRRDILKAGAIGAAALGFPSIIRAQPKEIVILGLWDQTGAFADVGPLNDRGMKMALEERGMKILGSHGIFRKESINEIDKLVDIIRNNPTLQRNWGLTLDEISINENPSTMLATCEALWKLTDLDKRVYTWCYSRISEKTYNPRLQQNLLSACSNVSRGEVDTVAPPSAAVAAR
jgi:hypothetical protein